MGLWNSLCGWFGLYDNDTSSATTGCEINPATALPMLGSVDSAGNPYGMDLHHDIGQADLMEIDWCSSSAPSSFDTSSGDSGSSTWDDWPPPLP